MPRILLGSGPLGQGAVAPATRFAPAGPYYLISDTFTTNRSAGAVNGTLCEPGPGRRVANDANNKITIATDKLTFAAGASSSWQQPAVYLAPAQNAIVGRLVFFTWTATSNRMRVGVSLATNQDQAWSMYAAFNVVNWRSGTPLAVGAFATSTQYRTVIAMRANGAYLFIKGGAFTEWRLLWIHTGTTPTPFYPHASLFDSTGTVDVIAVPATPWLPTPLVSDGFGATFGATDGAGHQEGIDGGIGAGGDGVTINASVGAWANASGKAGATALSGGVALAAVDAGSADVLIRADVTRSGGSAGVFLRYDADDYVYAVHDGTNVKLVKRVATVETTLINTAATYVAGAKLIVRAVGTAFRVYYNNALIGSEQTINDASLQSEAVCGLYTTDTGNTFDNLTVFAVGTGGEYAALDDF